jgi:hypothetical protein
MRQASGAFYKAIGLATFDGILFGDFVNRPDRSHFYAACPAKRGIGHGLQWKSSFR